MNSRLKGCLSASLLLSLISASAFADEGFGVKLYGTARLDAVYETNNSYNGDYIVGVRPQPTNGAKTDTFTMTANQSTVGVDATAPSVMGAAVSGKIEFDFYSPLNTLGYKTAPQMRVGYVLLNWADMKFSVGLGQQYDVFAFFPLTLNYGQFYRAGNVGYRRPMVKISKALDIGATELKLDVAVARPTAETVTGTALSESNSSADSGSPALQARLQYSMPLLTERKTVIGISGSKSNPRTFKTAPTSLGPDMSTYYTANQWHVGGDLTLPIWGTLTLKGRYYRGSDMSSYTGLGSSVYTTNVSQIEHGGYAQLSYGVSDMLDVMVTYGMAELETPSQALAGFGTKNIAWSLQAMYKFSKDIKWGVEYEDWASTYVGGMSYPDHRYQTAFFLNF